MPFATRDETGFPVPVLAQMDRKNFEICVPFKYRRRDDEEWIPVPKGPGFRRTDLASVPGFLLWLVPRYGAHTLAALLHDQLVKDPSWGTRSAADTTFRDALGELRVPLIRRWLMWAAVGIGTVWNAGAIDKARVALWAVPAVAAAAAFWLHLVAAFTELAPPSWPLLGRGAAWDLAVVALAGLLFTPRFGLGWLAGATVVLVLAPTIVVLAVTGVYVALEWAARGGLWLYNRTIARWFAPAPVANVRVMMSRARGGPAEGAAPRGCPELAPDAAPPA